MKSSGVTLLPPKAQIRPSPICYNSGEIPLFSAQVLCEASALNPEPTAQNPSHIRYPVHHD